jgi:hypothetical protein
MAGEIVAPGGAYSRSLPSWAMNTQTVKEQDYFLDVYAQYGEKSAAREGVYYHWGLGNRDSYGDMFILTFSQQMYHCGEKHPEFPCGGNIE